MSSAGSPTAGDNAAARWARVREIFSAALDGPPGARAALLARAAASDPDVAREVASLLAAHDAEDQFLEVSAVTAASRFVVDDGAARVGQRVGPYRLVREVGRGGMGVVYLAERADAAYHKRVAVKLIKRGMDTDAVVRRFRHERQILATLDHPDVARLLDGGATADGLPYVVMEYVDGLPIDAFCAARGLALGDRLRLFRRVCAAVHFAHQHLVLHRDLKPGNILVTADGSPKLLDFGLAKLLAGDGAGGPPADAPSTLAAASVRAMTPEYASPEQLRGEPLNTLSDVYSLGALLYELVTGERACRVHSRAPDVLARAVARPGPSGRGRAAPRGDLGTIVAKSMHPEPARRYVSAEQLGEDVVRFLERRPLVARPDTRAYRAARFARRNRAGVAAAALVAASLVGGLGATAWQARAARLAQARAERQFAAVRRLATSFLFDVDSAVAPLPGATAPRELLVRRALESLDGLAREAHDDPSLQRDLAAAYLKVGDVQGAPYAANLGHTGGALASYRKAATILERLTRGHPDDVAARERLAAVYGAMSAVQVRAGDVDGAVRTQRRAVALCDSLLARDPASAARRELLAQNLVYLGRAVYQHSSERAARAADSAYRRALALREGLLAERPADLDRRRGVASAKSFLSYAAWHLGDHTGDTTYYRAALALLGDAHADLVAVARLRVGDARAARNAADGLHEMARLHTLLGEPRAAERDLLEARPLMAALADADPRNAEALRDVAVIDLALADAYVRAGDAAGALAAARRTRALLGRIRAIDSTSADDLESLADLDATEAAVYRARGEPAAALARYDDARDAARRLAAAAPANGRAYLRLAAYGVARGELLWARGDRRTACARYAEARDAWRRAALGAPLGRADAARAARNDRVLADDCGRSGAGAPGLVAPLTRAAARPSPASDR